MRPEDALAHARRRADEHAAITIPPGGLEVERSDQPSDDQLVQWAVIEPDLREVRSTRRGPLGQAVTALKQGQLRLLGQYHAQVTSVQNRLNVHLSLRSTLMRDEIRALKEELAFLRGRVEELESRAGVEPPPDPVQPPRTFGEPVPEAPPAGWPAGAVAGDDDRDGAATVEGPGADAVAAPGRDAGGSVR